MTTLMLDAWAAVMWKACWQGSLVVLAVWSICLLIPSMPARCRCWLWRLAILKFMVALLMPTLVNLPLLPAHRAPEHMAEITTVVPTIPICREPLSHKSFLPIPESQPTPEPRLPVILFFVWIIGFGWSLALILVAWRGARKLRKQSRIIETTPLIEELAIQSRLYGLRSPPSLLETDGDGSPMLIGIFRPAIVVPAKTLRKLSPPELAMVLGHELAHIRRGDLLWSFVAAMVRATYFFNPLVWFGQRRLHLAQEIAADELAVVWQHGDPASYGNLLVSVVSKIDPGRSIPTMAMGTAGSVNSLTRRLVAMKSFGRASRGIIVASGILLVATVLLGLLPWRLVAAEPKPADIEARMETPKPWKLPNGITIWFGRGEFGPPINTEMYKLIAEKKYEFIKVFEGYDDEKHYVYRFNFSDGSFLNRDFSMPLDGVVSWDDYQKKQEEQTQQRHEKINQAITAGRYRLINWEVRQFHLCRDVAKNQTFKITRLPPLGDLKEDTAVPRPDYSKIPAGVKETSWREHLQAIREGKRELLALESGNIYTYEMISNDGTKVIFNYAGDEPLKRPENKGK